MIGTALTPQTVFDAAAVVALDPFLKGGFVIGVVEEAFGFGYDRDEQSAKDKFGGLSEATIEIDGGHDSFVGVFEKALLLAASGHFLAAAEAEIAAEGHGFGGSAHGNAGNEAGGGLGELAGIPI